MRTGTLLRNFMEHGTQPTPAELNQIEREINELDTIRDFQTSLTNGTGAIDCAKIKAHSGDFDIAPLQGLSMYYGTDVTSIPNNAETALIQSGWEKIYGYSELFRMNGDRIEVTYPSRIVGVFGTGNWASNSTGRRALSLKAYDKDDNYVTGATLYSFKGSGLAGVPDVYPGISWLTSNGDITYYKLFAYQNSGGNLDLEYYELTLFTIV